MIYKKSPAKINLFLKILNTREDGLHDLSSLMVLIDIFDEIYIEKSDRFSLEISGEFANLVNIKDNLFITILEYFQQHFAISNNLKIKLIKNIPVGAGLGGGSSNACQFMIILNEIFQLNLNKKQLQKISQNFGCDIAFFFENSPQIIAKTGEELFEYQNLFTNNFLPDSFLPNNFPWENYYSQNFALNNCLIIYPKINLSTKEVFQKFDQINDYKISQNITKNNEQILIKDTQNYSIKKLQELSIYEIFELPNDLENPALIIAPIIGEIRNNLILNGAKISKMSGSGSSVFGIFNDRKTLDFAYYNLNEIYPNFFIKKIFYS
jgi:4-diphosphocytidyl-2-C-methyl-D-erythritol kinase